MVTSTIIPSPARRRWLYGAVAAAASLGGAGLAWWKYSVKQPDEGAAQNFWRMSFDTPAGDRLAVESFKGRPLLVNFWATWCPPCVEELPLLDLFYAENSSKGWQVLGLAVDRPAAVNDFLMRHPLRFAVALAGESGAGLSKMLGNVSGGLPFSIVLGADGTIRQRKLGKLTARDLSAWRELK